MSYGTVMTAKLKSPGAAAELIAAGKKWAEERNVPGYQGTWSLVGDDGVSFVLCVSFDSKASYEALADDPAQDEWYRANVAPVLDGDPTWVDGEWAS